MKINSITLSIICTSFSFSSQALAEVNDTEQVTVKDIEQITVTATRTQTPLKAVAGNLSMLNSDDIEFINPQHINQSLIRVPGSWISRGNGQEHLTAIRSPVLTGAGGCGAFYMAQDGISLRAPGFCNANQLFDANAEQASRIEVLRGPSSTLYGSNAVHGVVNVISPNPFEQQGAHVGVTLGPNDYLKGQFVAGTVGEKQAFMVYGNASHDGGYKNDSGYGQQKLNLVHQFEEESLAIKSVVTLTNLNQETAGFIQGENAYKNGELKRDNPNPEAFRDNKTFKAHSQISYQVDDNTTIEVTPYVRWTDMAFLQHFLPWQSLEENSQLGFGFRSQYEKRYQELTLLVGIDTDFTEGELTETQAEYFSPTIPQGKHYDYQVQANVYSSFAQLQWQLSDTFTLVGGIRYEYTDYDYNNKLTNGSACEEGVTNCRFSRPADQSVDFNEVSYQLAGQYQLTENHSVYSQYSTGYRAPQATELFRLQAGQQVADLAAEQVDSIELGLRGQTDNFFYDVSAFSMHKDHFIFQDTNRQNINNGETSHKGVEFSIGYQLPKNFYVRANGTFARHEYDNAITLSAENIQGNEIDTAPEHMGSMQLGWQNDHESKVELEWVHLGNYYINPENSAEYAGHNLVNLTVSTLINRQWSVSARLLNLTDEDYAERADFGFGNYRYFVGEPRSLFVSMRYQFDK